MPNPTATHSPEPKNTNNRIFDILVEECAAPESDRPAFLYNWPCGEYRFQGALGFGGKIRSRSTWSLNGERHHSPDFFVDCYPEDLTPERLEMITNANRRLEELRRD